MTEDLLSLLAELQEAVQAGAVGSSLGLVSDCCPTLVCFWQSRCSVSPTVTVLPHRLQPQMLVQIATWSYT